MSSSWSTIDPVRRRLFLVALTVVVAMLGWVVVASQTADQPPPARGRGPAAITVAPTSPPPIAVPPPGREAGDEPPEPGRSREPLSLPPRYTPPAGLPVTDRDLANAMERALALMELFGNSRWDERADEKIVAIGRYVSAPYLDLVLSQYERVRAKEDRHQIVTYRVTDARWSRMSAEQLTLAISGDRQVTDDSGTRGGPVGFVVNLVKLGDNWYVNSVRDPDESDRGLAESGNTGRG